MINFSAVMAVASCFLCMTIDSVASNQSIWFDNKIWKEIGSYAQCSTSRIVGYHAKSARGSKLESVFELNDIKSLTTDVKPSTHFSGIGKKQRIWEDGVIPLKLEADLTHSELQKLACAVLFFHTKTCIKFVKRTNQKDYVKITAEKSDCYSTSLGNEKGEQVVNFARNNQHCWMHGTLIHELLHAAGMFHEHARNDRDQYIKVHWKRIPAPYRSQYKKASDLGVEQKLIGNYDYGSIMHYPRFIFKSDPLPTISATKKPKSKHNKRMGNRQIPTEMDIYKINTLYNCKTSTPANGIILLGGNSDFSNSIPKPYNDMEYYIPGRKSTRSSVGDAKMLHRRISHVAGVIQGRIIVAGGVVGRRALRSSEIFEPDMGFWEMGPDMLRERNQAAGAALDDKFFICGGSSEKEEHSSCEFYLSDQDRWFPMPKMSQRRKGAAAAAMGDYLYVLGGSSNGREVNLAEKYHVPSRKWSKMPPLKYAREGLAAAVLSDKAVVACGGESGFLNSRSCELYEPRFNKWRNFPSMVLRRSTFGLVSFNKKLYALAGYFSSSSKKTEVYDSRSKSWKNGPRLLKPRRQFAAVVL